MTKNLKRPLSVLLAVMMVMSVFVIVPAVVSAAESPKVTLELSEFGIPSSNTNGLNSYSNGTYSINLYSPSTNNYKFNSGYLLLGKKNAYLELPAFSFDVEKIVFTGTNSASTSVQFNVFVGDNAASTAIISSQGTLTFEINSDYQAAGNVYTLKVLNSYNVQFTKIEIYEKASNTAVTGVTLNPSAAQTIDVDEIVAFTASVEPNNATDKTVKWSVGGTNADAVKLYTNENCTTEVGADATSTLTVYAKGISAGSATVTATSNANNTKSASCDVTVTNPVSIQIVNMDAYIEGGKGYMRYITELTFDSSMTVDSYGTWFVPSDFLETDEYAVVKYENTPITSGQSYTADLLGIPESSLNRSIVGISFVNFEGVSETMTTISSSTVNSIIAGGNE